MIKIKVEVAKKYLIILGGLLYSNKITNALKFQSIKWQLQTILLNKSGDDHNENCRNHHQDVREKEYLFNSTGGFTNKHQPNRNTM